MRDWDVPGPVLLLAAVFVVALFLSVRDMAHEASGEAGKRDRASELGRGPAGAAAASGGGAPREAEQ